MEKVLKIINKNDDGNDFSYWKTKSFQESIDAIEILRSQYLQLLKDDKRGVERVYTIAKRKKTDQDNQ
jgi:hypothetical protein